MPKTKYFTNNNKNIMSLSTLRDKKYWMSLDGEGTGKGKFIELSLVFGESSFINKKLTILKKLTVFIESTKKDFRKRCWDEFWSLDKQQERLKGIAKKAETPFKAYTKVMKFFNECCEIDPNFIFLGDNTAYDMGILNKEFQEHIGVEGIFYRTGFFDKDKKRKRGFRCVLDTNSFRRGIVCSNMFHGVVEACQYNWCSAKQIKEVNELFDDCPYPHDHKSISDASRVMWKHVHFLFYLDDLNKNESLKKTTSTIKLLMNKDGWNSYFPNTSYPNFSKEDGHVNKKKKK